MMNLIETIPFTVNLTETDLSLKYPDLIGTAYLRNIVLNNTAYIIKITFNYYSNSPVFNLLNENEVPVISGLLLSPVITEISPNLLNYKGFNNYIMLWDFIQGFMLYERPKADKYEGI